MCLFSIITVCFNSEKTIKKTIESVLEQKNSNYEYIIIDGLSTDNTMKIIDNYKEKFDGRLKVISEKDKGIYDAMNKGIGLSMGKLIGFLNSDDYYEENILDHIENLYNDDHEFIYGNTKFMYEFDNGQIIRNENAVDEISIRSLNFGMGFSHQSCFVKKEIFNKIGVFNTIFKVGADWDFTIRCKKNNVIFKKYDITISCFSKDGLSSKSHILERHKIRSFNNMYRYIDKYLIIDFFNPSSLVQNLFGEKVFNKVRKIYHNKIKGLFRSEK